MPKPLSRRGFLRRAAVSSVSTVTTAAAASAAPGTLSAAAPQTKRPQSTPKQIADAYARADTYDDAVRVSVPNLGLMPHWIDKGDAAFWYRRDESGNKSGEEPGGHSFVRVETATGLRAPAFDHVRLAGGLAKTTGKPVSAAHLPFAAFDFVRGEKAVRFSVREQFYECDLANYVCVNVDAPPAKNAEPNEPRRRERRDAVIKNDNVWIKGADGTEIALTQAGTPENPFARLFFSPGGKQIAAFRKTSVSIAPVYMVESSPENGGTRGVLHEHSYAQPGDLLPSWELWVLRAEAKTAFRADAFPWTGEGAPDPLWSHSSDETGAFLMPVPDRGHQRFRVIEVKADGKTRTLLDETAGGETGQKFINTSNGFQHLTHDGRTLFHVSERDGWRHIYACDVPTGTLKQITKGPWVVRDILEVDEKAAQIYFWGSGKNENEDPYNKHLYRIAFDGTNLTELTGGNGTHSVQFSPTRRFLVDTYSRPDLPPVHSLRRADTGAEVCVLEKADVLVQKAGWKMPEVFCAKGRDKQTDIWGIVFRPTNFNPKKRYPVIENIYAGPQNSFVRKNFAVRDSMQNLAELGFIVVQCDGMGTRNRSKAFHDVCWRDLKDAGLPDRIAWISALAHHEPACDISRVGIYGTSAGGQNVTSALLLHGDFYYAGVASCGCHDNRVDKLWWNEQWMGYPIGPHYAKSASVTYAENLRGKLFLMVGELDTNVPPESTLRLADALIKAGKDFDLLVLPGQNHGSGGVYGERRRRDYFVQHLLNVSPPDRNAPRPPAPKPAPMVLTAHDPGETYRANGERGGDTTIIFRNQTRETVRLFWLESEAADPIPYGVIAPQKIREQHTFAGHVWLVETEAGRPIALFVGEARLGIADITP